MEDLLANPTAQNELTTPARFARPVLPLELEGDTLKVIIADPYGYDTILRLAFILNKELLPVVASREQITEAINWYYERTETEYLVPQRTV